VEHARVEERSIMRHWVMRMTVHLIPVDDYGWLAPLFRERMIRWSHGRLGILGIEDRQRDKAMAAMRDAIGRRGAMTRGELVEVAERTGLDVTTQVRTHLMMLLVVEGSACIGPDVGRGSALVATGDWIGRAKRRGREESLAELARRYLGAFAPASERDFASWSGLPLGDCRVGLERIASELREVQAGDETLLAPKGWAARLPRSPLVRLLPAFDTYLMGYASRAHAVDDTGAKRILPGGGILRPTVCVDGKFVALWSSKRSGQRLKIELEPFAGFDEAWRDAIAAEVADIGRFEGVEAVLA
jgi:Winged helix DNA-binding domain